MPPAIAAAAVAVMKQAKQLGYDEKNDHGKYPFASIDKFLATFRPLMSEAGLFLLIDEVDSDIRAGESGKGWLFIRYDVCLAHESGETWGPLRRHCAMPISGPQAFGAAQSYIIKQFMRALFMVPTGEHDADETAPSETAPITRPPAHPAPSNLKSAVEARLNGAASQQAPQGRSIAQATWERMRAEIHAALSIEQLNATGLHQREPMVEIEPGRWLTAAEEAQRILQSDAAAVKAGAWQKLIDQDARRRLELAAQEES